MLFSACLVGALKVNELNKEVEMKVHPDYEEASAWGWASTYKKVIPEATYFGRTPPEILVIVLKPTKDEAGLPQIIKSKIAPEISKRRSDVAILVVVTHRDELDGTSEHNWTLAIESDFRRLKLKQVTSQHVFFVQNITSDGFFAFGANHRLSDKVRESHLHFLLCMLLYRKKDFLLKEVDALLQGKR